MIHRNQKTNPASLDKAFFFVGNLLDEFIEVGEAIDHVAVTILLDKLSFQSALAAFCHYVFRSVHYFHNLACFLPPVNCAQVLPVPVGAGFVYRLVGLAEQELLK